jgi:Uma2 family endonuclease
VSNGIWEQEKLELINGELISKMGSKMPHVFFLNRMMQWLVEALGWGRVYQNAPIDVAPGDNPIARAGIVEYWVLDVSGRRLIVHREPTPAGYRSVAAYSESERVAPLASAQHELPIGDLFA